MYYLQIPVSMKKKMKKKKDRISRDVLLHILGKIKLYLWLVIIICTSTETGSQPLTSFNLEFIIGSADWRPSVQQ